jgi:hypothetical protein
MNIISARSPYQVIVNESLQTGSKVELFIWNKGTTEPTIATTVLSKNIPSTTQTENNYNISPYILEYINQIAAVAVTTPTVESNTTWCFVRIKRYKNVSGTYTLLDNLLYVGLNSYTDVISGYNFNFGDDAVLLGNIETKIQYYNTIPYYNFLCERQIDLSYEVLYYNSSNTLISSTTFLTAGAFEIYNFKIPLAVTGSVKCLIQQSNENISYIVFTEKIEECKYTPVNCSFVNKNGGWQQLTFFKAQSNIVNVKGTEYGLMQQNVNYDYQLGQKKLFNINGTQTVKLNTGWVYENYNELITQLLLSDTILLNGLPVTLKTQSLTYKTNILDKNINFEIEFEYSNSLINNLV